MIKNIEANTVEILTIDLTKTTHSTIVINCNKEDVYKIYGSIA
jgi:hypothetical protein